jgi:DNA-binding MarR family transcriptional regulator
VARHSRQSAVENRESRVESRESPADPRGGAGRRKVTPASTLSLDRLIHERLRLGIVSALAVNQSMTFSELKQLLETTDGNLSVHARKLEDAGYVSCEKTFDDRMPRTEYRLTAAGRRAFDKYLRHMEALIGAVKP